jgi:hypothetical protein
MSATWTWSVYLILVLVYWMVVIGGWIMMQRRRGENQFEFAGEISSTLQRVGLVLLGPPILALIVLLVG